MEGYQEIWKLWYRPLAFMLFKAFFKEKISQDLVSQSHFYMMFEEKYFSRYILLTDQIQTV